MPSPPRRLYQQKQRGQTNCHCPRWKKKKSWPLLQRQHHTLYLIYLFTFIFNVDFHSVNTYYTNNYRRICGLNFQTPVSFHTLNSHHYNLHTHFSCDCESKKKEKQIEHRHIISTDAPVIALSGHCGRNCSVSFWKKLFCSVVTTDSFYMKFISSVT